MGLACDECYDLVRESLESDHEIVGNISMSTMPPDEMAEVISGIRTNGTGRSCLRDD